jgi:hypothetical protein
MLQTVAHFLFDLLASTSPDIASVVQSKDRDGLRTDPDILDRFRDGVSPSPMDFGDGKHVLLIMMLMLVALTGSLYSLSRAQTKTPLVTLVVALAIVANAPTWNPPPLPPSSSLDVMVPIPLPSEYQAEDVYEEGKKALFSYVLLKKEHKFLDDYMASSTVVEALTVAQLVGAISNRVEAARLILGKQLKESCNAELKEGLDIVTAAVEAHSDVQANQVQFAKKVATQIVPAWEDLADEIEETNKVESGWFFHAFGSSVSVSTVPTKYGKEVQQEVANIENGGPTTFSLQKVKGLYGEAKNLLRTSLENIPATTSFTNRVDKAEEEVQEAAKKVVVAKENLIEASRNEAFARANRDAYREVQSSHEDMHDRISEQIRQKHSDLQASERRLRDYTWNMWGWRIGMWENDVKLARQEVTDAKKDIGLLEVRLAQHEANALKAKDHGGLQATIEAEYKEASLRKDQCSDGLEQAEQLFKMMSSKLAQVMEEVDQALRSAGVHTEKELRQLRQIHATISRDAKVIQAAARMDADPFDQLRTELGRVVSRMQREKTLLPQAKWLRKFVEKASGQNVSSRQTAWQVLLKVYSSMDTTNFAKLISGEQPDAIANALS